MAVWRKSYTSKKTGVTKTYEYPDYGYYVSAEARALKCLKRRPLKRVINKSGGGWKWTAGQRGPIFFDATIVKLIQSGKAVCFGDFVELKGVQR